MRKCFTEKSVLFPVEKVVKDSSDLWKPRNQKLQIIVACMGWFCTRQKRKQVIHVLGSEL